MQGLPHPNLMLSRLDYLQRKKEAGDRSPASLLPVRDDYSESRSALNAFSTASLTAAGPPTT